MLPKIRRSVAVALSVACVLACSPATARADAGISMLPVDTQAMAFFLLLVIIIAIIYLQARLKTSFPRTLVAVTTVNTATTGLGFPLTYGMYALFNSWASFPGGMSGAFTNNQFVPLWVCQKIFPDLAGMHSEVYIVLAVFVTLLIPSYVLTRLIKNWIFQWYDFLRYEGDVRPAVLMANRLSYLMIALTGCMLLFRTFHEPSVALFH